MPKTSSLSNVLKRLIKRQTTSVGPVGNLYGVPLDAVSSLEISREGDWIVYYLDILDQLAPNSIINLLASSRGSLEYPIIQSIDGTVEFTEQSNGTYMYSTIVDSPRDISFSITIQSNGKQIAIYADETLIARGTNSLIRTLNLSEGLTPLNIITIGSPSETTITVPRDIRTVISSFADIDPPQWRSPIPIETNYVDPITGSAGNGLFWQNQSNVGGWGVYRVNSLDLGTVTAVGVVKGRYLLTINVPSSSPSIGSTLRIGTDILGTVEAFSVDSGTGDLSIRVISDDDFIPLASISGSTVESLSFSNIANVNKTNEDVEVSYVDLNVANGQEYSYALDSFVVFDQSLRSNKSEIRSAVAGDATPPGSITINSFQVVNDHFFINYTTPSDTDYLATRVYYENSGTSIKVDYGFPGVQDQVDFEPVASGTYYFPTVDRVGNEQSLGAAASLFWDGSSISTVGAQPPYLIVRQLTTAEKISGSFDPINEAVFVLDADDPDTAKALLTLEYQRFSDLDWIAVAGGSLPVTVVVDRSDAGAWIRVRVTDDQGLSSSELTFNADLNNNPQVVSADGVINLNTGQVDVIGSVDDDTTALQWWITSNFTGPTGSDPTVGSPALISGLEVLKIFSFSFDLSDGQKKELIIRPISTSYIGIDFTDEFERPPRTFVSFLERSLEGSVQRSEVNVTLSSSPEDAVTYKKQDPIDYGDVGAATSTTMESASDPGWADDQWNTYYDVRIISGTGAGQTRQITDTFGINIISVNPAWTIIPDSTSKYHIAERFRHYKDNGTVSAATVTTISDGTKAWVPNSLIGKTAEIVSGPGTGETREIISNTATQITVATSWNTTPTTSSTYRIFGAFNIVRDTEKDIQLSFYSEIPGITVEEVKTAVVDFDSIPEIGTLTLDEVQAGILQVTISGLDDDVKDWILYARKSNWPTTDDTEFGPASEDYIRYAGTASVRTVDFSVGNGDWFVIAIPFDSFSTPGPRLTDSITIAGVSSSAGSLITLNATHVQNTAQDREQGNRIRWQHNLPVRDNPNFTVKVFGRRSDDPAGEQELTLTETKQYLRPVADITDNGWVPATGVNNWDQLNQAVNVDFNVGSGPPLLDDLFYIEVPSPSTTDVRFFEVDLRNPFLVVDTAQDIKVVTKLRRNLITPGAGDSSVSTDVELRQGAVVIATRTFNNFSTTAVEWWQNLVFSLTTGEKAAITDFNDLRIRVICNFTPQGGSPSTNMTMRCSQAFLVTRVTPPIRIAHYDSEQGLQSSNFDDTTSSGGDFGSFFHIARKGTTTVTWYYKVELYDTAVFVDSWDTQVTSQYQSLTSWQAEI